jgi:hypothetical protein
MRNSFPNPVYVDDILLVSSDVNLLLEKKKFLSSRFNKKVLGEMSLVIRIKIHRDRRKGVLRLSHKHAKKSFQRNKIPMRVNLHLFPWSRIIILRTLLFQEAM